jgi:hypothetical protein
MNTKKSQFLSAVRIIANDDSFILDLAECVSEETLPDFPGAAALRFVTAVSRLCEEKSVSIPQTGVETAPRRIPVCNSHHRRLTRAVPIPIRHVCDSK